MVKYASLPGHATQDGSLIEVTAQQSRFHANASDSAPPKEIIVKNLGITVGERELLGHAELNLQPGRHYVLIGRNGVGKSTLLKAIGTGMVPGIPASLKVLLMGQVQNGKYDSNGEAMDPKETVLRHVVRSDSSRERLLDEERCLSAAAANTTDTLAVLRVYRGIQHQRLEQRTAEARVIAARQSGSRGLKARKELLRLEGEIQQSMNDLSGLTFENLTFPPAETVASEMQRAFDLLTEIQVTLESMDPSAAEPKARAILLALGIPEDSLNEPITQLSGGWKTKCDLACALYQPADLLLLDEPTNFLDLPSIIWLENYIKRLRAETTVVVVTHDRAFADSIAEELLILRNLALETFRGNVLAYELNRLKTYKHMSHMAEAQEKQKKHMQSSIDSNVKAAAHAGDDKKLKQAVSRKKKLEERMGMQTSAKGTRFKLNRDHAGYHLSLRDEIEIPTFDAPAKMKMPLAPSDLRFPGALLSCESVSFTYPRSKVPISKDINLVIHSGERIGIAGLNGSGKSTLVNLIMSTAGGPTARSTAKGTMTAHTRAKFGLYSQAAVEELTDLGNHKPSLTALVHLLEVTGQEMEEKHARGLLSSIGLPPKTQSDVPIILLSGGQKVRLALAKVLWNPPHLLILDEVTTHLDSDTIQALALALRKYEGAILVITHDRFFMRCVIEGESPLSLMRRAQDEALGVEDDEGSSDEEGSSSPGVVYRLSKGVLTKLDGGMQQYEVLAGKAAARFDKPRQ